MQAGWMDVVGSDHGEGVSGEMREENDLTSTMMWLMWDLNPDHPQRLHLI